ncbi:hypothetical protein FBU59_004718 [Linderina macrospora]|uniref:Uncharacterized protein n=1 Tax=Linderina macrospora TaxID=4868 RepID=A0ACC1J4X8_9FUNG|nr:hypothetical protein FBU59_004718 [Linderina macrospora]
MTLRESPSGDDDTLLYSLSVIQQPKRARAVSTGERDRRPIDPCPIVQLQISTREGVENIE